MLNMHGLDTCYIRKNLEKLLIELEHHTPEEMRRALIRLSETCDNRVVTNLTDSEKVAILTSVLEKIEHWEDFPDKHTCRANKEIFSYTREIDFMRGKAKVALDTVNPQKPKEKTL